MKKIGIILLAVSMIVCSFALIDPDIEIKADNSDIPTRNYNDLEPVSNISDIASASFVGGNPGDNFGSSLSIIGDINGDGYSDMALSAPENDTAGNDAGQVYLIFGGANKWSMDITPDQADASFLGERENDLIGRFVSGTGDVNGDGYDDLLIGSVNYPGNQNNGKSYLIFGKPDGWTKEVNVSTSNASYIGNSNNDCAGVVAGAGDVNNDGFSDFLIGAFGEGNPSINGRGSAYLVLGRSSDWSNNESLSNTNASFIGEGEGDLAGASLCGTGDVNGDGFDDLLIGASQNNNSAGRTYLILGKNIGWNLDNDLSNSNASFDGEYEGDRSALSLSGPGDVNNDGFDDILIGAVSNDEGGVNSGQTYLIFGKSSGWAMSNNLSRSDASFIGPINARSGTSISKSGDHNGDDYDDIVISAPAYNGDYGIIYVIYGREYNWSMDTDISNSDVVILGEEIGMHLANPISTSGDLNRDGNDDVILGASFGLDQGKVFLVFGKGFAWRMNTPLSLADATFLGENQWDLFGFDSEPVGDVNGDGLNDWISCAFYNSEGGDYSGQVYLFLGKLEPFGLDFDISNADASFLGEVVFDKVGPLCGIGDVNNDTYDDFLISSPWHDHTGNNAGKVYLIYGKPTGWKMDTSLSEADASFLGEREEDQAGIGMSGNGDVNGDGIDDFIIGAIGNDRGGENAGQTYLFFGKEEGWKINQSLSDADASFIGVNPNDGTGLTPNIVGDVNADGFDDILINTNQFDWGVTERVGEVYLIFGKEFFWGMNTSLILSDASFIEERVGSDFGRMEGPAGDVNGDGFDDILIVAAGAMGGISTPGKVYLYFGKEEGWEWKTNVSEANTTFIGEELGSYTGWGGATGDGDLNADGYNDIVIGNSDNSYASPYAGKSYVIFGQPHGYPKEMYLENADGSFVGENRYDYSGTTCRIIGDVNGDGYDDLWTTAYGNDDNGNYAGKGYLIYGREFPGSKPEIQINDSYILEQLDPTETLEGDLEITWDAWDEESWDDLWISIYYRFLGNDWTPIAENVMNTGSFIWNTTSPRVPDGQGYEIMVKAVDYSSQTTISKMSFTFGIDNPDPPEIDFYAPIKNEQLQDWVTISWDAYDDEDDSGDLLIDIYLQNDDMGTNYTIIMNTENKGSYSIHTVDYPDGENYYLKILITDISGLVTEFNSDTFSIMNNPSIVILLPVEQSEISGDYEIFWEANDPSEEKEELMINIWISDDNGEIYTLIAENISNSGSMIIDTREFDDGENYRLKMEVIDQSGLTTVGISGLFAIFNNDIPVVYFRSPLPDTIVKGEYIIEWNATDPEDDPQDLEFSLYYQFSGQTIWNQLAYDLPNTGSMTIDTLDLIEGDGQYGLMIKVKDSHGGISESATTSFFVYNPDNPEIKYPFYPYGQKRDGTAEFSWLATDPDPGETEQLMVWFYFSIDGEDWTPIVSGVQNRDSLIMDISIIVDGEYFIKMMISDCQPGENNRSTELVFEDKMVVNNVNDPPVIEVLNMPSVDVTYSEEVSFSWEGTDEDGDEISYSLYYRMKGDESWIPIEGAIDILETSYSWDVSNLEEEGYYQVKIVAKENYEDELEMEWISEEFHVRPITLDIGNEDREVTINSGLMVGIVIGAVVLTIIIVWILFLSARRKPEEEHIEEEEKEEEEKELDEIDRLLLEKANETPVPITTPEPGGPVIDQIPEDIENDRPDLGTPALEMDGEEPEISEPNVNNDPDGVLGPPLEPSEPSPPGAPDG